MNGYRLRVCVGRDGIMFVSCFSVSIVCIYRKAIHDYKKSHLRREI